ncbi:MAG: hypothetical protein ACK479_16975 [Fluviicola sp.]|jgi:hypothetical protein
MNKLILILFLLILNITFGQTIHLEFSGKANSGKDSPLKNVLIHFIQKNDTLCVLKTDENGNYSCEFDVESRDSISIYASKYGYQESKDILNLNELSSFNIQVSLDFFMLSVCTFHKDPSVYYQKNKTKKIDYIDLELLRNIFEEYPTVCVKFGQTIHPDESKRIAKKRMNNFRKYLIENKIDIRNTQFEETYFILDEKQLEKDPRSRIQGIIVSFEGN